MLDTTRLETMAGRDVVDADGDKIGTVDEVYVDDESGVPEFALVKSGLFGLKRHFVPIRDARTAGDELQVPYSKDRVTDAPSLDPDGELSEAEEAELYRYYGIAGSGATAGTGDEVVSADRGDTADEAMTRSEEELRVGTEHRQAARVRLRKYVTTEQVTKTVPVQREHVRVEREPVTDANRDQAMAGPDISEGEHEVVLTEEEPVVEKRAVPKERVRLAKDTVTDEETVSEDVRKERIDVDDPDNRTDR
jgi:uncharacterized protein (TIGR02271 family)